MRHELIFRLGARGLMRMVGKTQTRLRVSCVIVAACPFVDVVDEGGTTRRAGEILRDLRGAGAYALQSLPLLGATARTWHVRLSEEKAETTYLDELYVEVDGERVAPRACDATSPAYCAADHVPYLVRRGETLDVVFDLPESSASPELFARGYYVPTASAD